MATSSKDTSKTARFEISPYYGLADGTCVVRYDNETSKEDHSHIKGLEAPYHFRNVDILVKDFLEEIEKVRRQDQ